MFDGDTGSVEYLISEDAVKEIDNILNSARQYINPNGGLIYSSGNDITDLVLFNMTGDPKEVS